MHFSGSHAMVIIAALQAAVASYASSLKQQDFHDEKDKLPGRVYFNMHPLGGDPQDPGAVINIEIGCMFGRWGQQPHLRTVWVNFPSEEDNAKFHTFSVSLLAAKNPEALGSPDSVDVEYPELEYMTDSTIANAQYLGKRLGELICQFLDKGSFEPGDFQKLSKR